MPCGHAFASAFFAAFAAGASAGALSFVACVGATFAACTVVVPMGADSFFAVVAAARVHAGRRAIPRGATRRRPHVMAGRRASMRGMIGVLDVVVSDHEKKPRSCSHVQCVWVALPRSSFVAASMYPPVTEKYPLDAFKYPLVTLM